MLFLFLIILCLFRAHELFDIASSIKALLVLNMAFISFRAGLILGVKRFLFVCRRYYLVFFMSVLTATLAGFFNTRYLPVNQPYTGNVFLFSYSTFSLDASFYLVAAFLSAKRSAIFALAVTYIARICSLFALSIARLKIKYKFLAFLPLLLVPIAIWPQIASSPKNSYFARFCW